MTNPAPSFLALPLLKLAMDADEVYATICSRSTLEELKGHQRSVVNQVYRAVRLAVEKESKDWSADYALEVITHWDKACNLPYSALTHYGPQGEKVAEAIELALVENQAFPWASPVGEPPRGAHAEELTKQCFARVKKAISRKQHALTHRLLSWPGAAQQYVDEQPFATYGRNLKHFSEGGTGWASMVLNFDPGALQVFLDRGVALEPRDTKGRPTLAYADHNGTVDLFLKRGWDLLSSTQPAAQRITDAQHLLTGWNTPLRNHFNRSHNDSRHDFSAGLNYLNQTPGKWPLEERMQVLFPLLADGFLTKAFSSSKQPDPVVNWALQCVHTLEVSALAQYPVKEGNHTWTFEQWCAVRFFRGHSPNMPNPSPSRHGLARAFSKEKAVLRGQTTEDLQQLINWFYYADANISGENLVTRVPPHRLIPLLAQVFEGDTGKPEPDRHRLHRLMAAFLGSARASEIADVGPLLVEYTQWVWKDRQAHAETPQEHILQWLTTSPHACRLSPEDRHFLVVNNLDPTQPLRPLLKAAAWAVLEKSIAEGGHEQDQKTPQVPAHANQKARASDPYQGLIKAASLSQTLPNVAPAPGLKPRF